MLYRIDESAPGSRPIQDLRFLSAEEPLGEGWLELGPEPLQLLLRSGRRLLRVVYRRGETGPLTSLAVFPQSSKPDRRLWSPAQSQEFRSAAKDSPAEYQALWLRRGSAHPPVRRLARITGQWSDMTNAEWLELRSQWKLLQYEFSDTSALFDWLAFSTRPA